MASVCLSITVNVSLWSSLSTPCPTQYPKCRLMVLGVEASVVLKASTDHVPIQFVDLSTRGL